MPADRRRPTDHTVLGRLRVPARRTAPTAGRPDTAMRCIRTHVLGSCLSQVIRQNRSGDPALGVSLESSEIPLWFGEDSLTQIRIGCSQTCLARRSTRAKQTYPPRSARCVRVFFDVNGQMRWCPGRWVAWGANFRVSCSRALRAALGRENGAGRAVVGRAAGGEFSCQFFRRASRRRGTGKCDARVSVGEATPGCS